MSDLKKISKKIVKTHLRGNIFKQYQDMVGTSDEIMNLEEESDDELKADKILQKLSKIMIAGDVSDHASISKRSASKESDSASSMT